MSTTPAIYNVSAPVHLVARTSCFSLHDVLTVLKNPRQHRPMQPSGVRTNTAAGPPQVHPGPSFSLNDALDAIKREYNLLASEVVGIRNQRDELEAKRTPFVPLSPLLPLVVCAHFFFCFPSQSNRR